VVALHQELDFLLDACYPLFQITVNLMRYICNYQYQNENRSLEIEADSHEDAKSQISAIAYTGTITHCKGGMDYTDRYQYWLLLLSVSILMGLGNRFWVMITDGFGRHWHFAQPTSTEVLQFLFSAGIICWIFTLKPKKS